MGIVQDGKQGHGCQGVTGIVRCGSIKAGKVHSPASKGILGLDHWLDVRLIIIQTTNRQRRISPYQARRPMDERVFISEHLPHPSLCNRQVSQKGLCESKLGHGGKAIHATCRVRREYL